MKITTPLELAKAIEKKNGDAMWRYDFVVPAELSATKKKEYHFEFPDKTSDQIKNGFKSKSGKFQFPGRGWKDVKSVPDFLKKSGTLNDAYTGISMYLKFVKDLYVIDFDEGFHDTEPTSDTFNPFFKFCIDQKTIFIQTKKGYHFYFYLPGTPDFTCFTQIQSEDCFGAVDILGRKMPSVNNVVEASHHEVQNGELGVKGIKSVPWEDMSEFLNVDRMLGKSKKNDKQTKKEKNENKAICSDGQELDREKFCGYLARLRKEDHPTITDKKSRYHYEDFCKVGMICKNNFGDDEVGFDVWRTWVREDPYIADDTDRGHSHRSSQYLLEKWNSYEEVANPLTWKTLRSWANDDDPSKNTYQEIYDQCGLDGMVEYMNGFLMLNVATSEILYENPNETKHYDTMPCMFGEMSKVVLIFDKYTIFVPDAKGEVKPKNPFSLWKKHIGCRHVNRIVFDPSPTAPTDVYNLFGGFEISKLDVNDMTLKEAEQGCRHLLEHIFRVWCHGNQVHYDFVLNWFSFLLQKPWIKIGILLAVKSKEGAGKGIVFDFMRSILGGRLYAQITSLDQLIGTHNSVLEGRLLINGDEIIWGGNIKDGNSMKAVITETEVWIHEKYRARYRVQNTSAICISSNEDRSLSAREGDRRSFGLELSNLWAGRQKSAEHKAYFCNISGTNHHGIASDKAQAFAKVLYSRDLTHFVPQNAPITELLTEQMERNYTPLQKFWKDLLNQGSFTIEDRFKKQTRETYVEQNDFGAVEKQRWLDYDEEQLLWGNVGEKWGNGFKDVETSYENTNTPILAYAFCEHSDFHDDSPFKLWKSALRSEAVQKCLEDDHIEPLTKEEVERIPIHISFLNQVLQRQGGRKWEKEEQHALPSELQGYTWTKGEGWNGGCYLENLDLEDDYYPWGLRQEHLQEEGKGSLRMEKKYNWDGEEETAWEFGATKGNKAPVSWHFDNDVPDMFEEITAMAENSHADPSAEAVFGGSIKGDNKLHDWRHTPVHYYRDNGDGDIFFKDEDEEKTTNSGYVHRDYDKKFGKLEVLEPEAFTEYVEKWREGVTADNHKEDLVEKEWFGADGQLFFKKKNEKITRWVYDRDWVYHRYKESVGIGYGQENLDKSAFWKGILEMQGGKSSDGNGGVYKTIKCKDNSKDRKAYWKFVSLEKNREMFQKWTGRVVKWDDEEEEEEFPEDWY